MGADWETVLADFASIQTVAGAILATFGTAVYQNFVKDSDTLLEGCKKGLEEVKARLDEIPPERGEQIRAAAERKVCKSLETLREELLKSAPSTNIMSMSLRDLIRPGFLMIVAN